MLVPVLVRAFFIFVKTLMWWSASPDRKKNTQQDCLKTAI